MFILTPLGNNDPQWLMHFVKQQTKITLLLNDLVNRSVRPRETRPEVLAMWHGQVDFYQPTVLKNACPGLAGQFLHQIGLRKNHLSKHFILRQVSRFRRNKHIITFGLEYHS